MKSSIDLEIEYFDIVSEEIKTDVIEIGFVPYGISVEFAKIQELTEEAKKLAYDNGDREATKREIKKYMAIPERMASLLETVCKMNKHPEYTKDFFLNQVDNLQLSFMLIKCISKDENTVKKNIHLLESITKKSSSQHSTPITQN